MSSSYLTVLQWVATPDRGPFALILGACIQFSLLLRHSWKVVSLVRKPPAQVWKPSTLLQVKTRLAFAYRCRPQRHWVLRGPFNI